jgi:hypothetical protein
MLDAAKPVVFMDPSTGLAVSRHHITRHQPAVLLKSSKLCKTKMYETRRCTHSQFKNSTLCQQQNMLLWCNQEHTCSTRLHERQNLRL